MQRLDVAAARAEHGMSAPRFRRRQLAHMLAEAAAHRATSAHVAQLMRQMAEAILAGDQRHFDPPCTCYRGLEFVPDADCPACSANRIVRVRAVRHAVPAVMTR